MSTPQVESQKRSRKTTKKGNTPSMRSAVSETEGSDYPQQSQSPAADGQGRHRRKSTAKKNNNTNYDSAAHSDGPNVRQNHYPPKHHATPIKNQAYAGPTFHQSPAASALPIPSFYSKSLPTNGIMKAVPEDDRPSTQTGEAQQHPSPPAEVKREATPLDFLFEAARKAHATPRSDSPQHRFLSPQAGQSPARSPAPREGDTFFQLEMDPEEMRPRTTSVNSSTPFKDKLEAIRPAGVTSPGAKNLDDEERRAKSAALKNFLMSSAKHVELGDNPFNARPAPQYQQSWPYQRHSNPGTPQNNPNGGQPNQQYFPQFQYGPYGPGSPGQKPPPSNLRHTYSPELGRAQSATLADGERGQTPISTARHQTPAKHPYQGYHTPPNDASPEHRAPVHRATPSAQQLEDDLRRVLKLDLASQG